MEIRQQGRMLGLEKATMRQLSAGQGERSQEKRNLLAIPLQILVTRTVRESLPVVPAFGRFLEGRNNHPRSTNPLQSSYLPVCLLHLGWGNSRCFGRHQGCAHGFMSAHFIV